MSDISTREEELHLTLAEKEGWRIEKNPGVRKRTDPRWLACVREHSFPLRHPVKIHLGLYRRERDVELKYEHMKAAHDYLWPEYVPTWHAWEERAFRAHCSGFETIVMAAGGGAGKSSRAARIALLFYLAWPKERAVVVASVTAESLESRIWGYVQNFAYTAIENFGLPLKVYQGRPPKILPARRIDKISGMFAVAIQRGEAEKVISTLIGRHPKDGLMFFLDEATDMSPTILEAIPNLRKGTKFFQLWAIGNSNSRNDLHGALATPRGGWEKHDPMMNDTWETARPNGVCLYFNPYKSPAILDPSEKKRELLAAFLPTLASIEADKRERGEHSEAFWRMTLGLWKSQDEKVVVTSQFLDEHKVYSPAEWSGFYPLEVVAGLDPAFQYGGTGCVLRLAYFGHTVEKLMALDFRYEELVFRIEISPKSMKSAERQIGEQVLAVLKQYGVPLYRLAIDCTGPGKPMAELLTTMNGGGGRPIKVSFTGLSKAIMRKKDDPAMITGTPTDFYFLLRDFVHNNQIRGLDQATAAQLTTRLLEKNEKTGKHQLETKDTYIGRMQAIDSRLAHSPDEADAAVLAVVSAVFGLGFHKGQMKEMPVGTRDDAAAAKLYAFRAEKEGVRVAGNGGMPKLMPKFAKPVESMVRRLVPND